LSLKFKNTDRFFLELTFALIAFGLIFAFTSSSHESYRLTGFFWSLGIKQLIAFFIGFMLFILFWFLNYRVWFKVTWNLAFVILIIMILTVFTNIGKTSGGAQRWIDIGHFQFQPAEIAKFSVLLLMTRQLTVYKWFEKKSYYYIVFALAIILIILKQPDLGSAALLVLLGLQLFFLFEWPLWLLGSFIAIAAYGGFLKIQTTPYQLDRIKFWLDPFLEPQGRGYNLIQAKYALGLGSIFGSGIGSSIQKQGYLPVSHSDFIFAVIGEEIGFIGVSVIIILFLTWILRGLHLINKTQDKYGKILGTGIILLIGTQAVINITVATGLMPVTGITLPFFSCGGTSLIVTLAMCGILFNVISTNNNEHN